MYKIVLYNHGKRVRHFSTHKLYGEALTEYKKILKENKVYFPREFLWNGSETDYRLVLTAPPGKKGKTTYRDKTGAIKAIKTKPDFIIKQIENYAIEETFINRITRKRINFKSLVKMFMENTEVTYVVNVINNKVVIERFENSDVDVLVLKNKDTAWALSETIRLFTTNNKMGNFIFFQELSKENKSRIYKMLETDHGIKREHTWRDRTR